MKIIYMRCGEETIIFGPYGIWTHDLCDTDAALYQLS